MDFGHDMVVALSDAVALVNTAPEAGGREGLPDLAALRRFAAERRLTEIGTPTLAELAEVRAVRSDLRAVFLASSRREAAELLNTLLAGVRIAPRLTDHDDFGWHVHYFAAGAGMAHNLAADCAMALARLVVAGEHDRLRSCAAPACANLFVDMSRNRSRRYCDSRTCGNRLHVAAYRARHRDAG
ncbi:MAG: CGNR zinc finger domain-containing protein [Mycobacteriales bacterium]